ncbi:MAG: nucleotidyltransferase domain-containing protein [Nitrososphaera sp.]|jgi:predicted nucleotidyltransferase
MITESIAIPKVIDYLASNGWQVKTNVKLRGRVPDLVATKGEKICIIEVKASGDIQKGIEQTLHMKKAANFSYLALPNDRTDDRLMDTCRNLGIGLMTFNGAVKELVRPAESEPLPSIKQKLLQLEPAKRIVAPEAKNPLEFLFRTRGQILIMRFFFLNPNAELHINEIARRTDLSPSYVTTELRILQQIGLVVRKEQGNQVLYRANTKSIIYEDLKCIFIKYILVDYIIAKNLTASSSEEEIKYALIYGSFAKGTERESSDIDLLVVGKIDDDVLLNSIMNAQREIGREINYILWTEQEFQQKSRERIALLREILKTPVIMIIGEEREFKGSIENRAD